MPTPCAGIRTAPGRLASLSRTPLGRASSDLTPSTRALAAARAWRRAVADGRVESKGGDRKSNAQNALLIKDPRRRFSRLFDAGEKYTEQAYALVTRDPSSADAVEKGE